MGRNHAHRWLAVAAWITFIYAAIPFVRELRDIFVARLPARTLGYAVIAIVAGATVAAIFALGRQRKTLHLADIAWLTGIGAVLVVWTLKLMQQPEEAVHFVEYGVLGALLYRALRPHMDNPGVFVAGALIGTLVGTVDEIIQWIVPDRYWDFRDLVLNGGASALVQIALWRLASRPFSRVTPSTVRVVIRLVALEVLVLMLCLAATPQRISTLARSLPVLTPLADGNDVICEYGYLHNIDSTTLFKSRLSRRDLGIQDQQRSFEVAAMIDQFGGKYRDFLKSVTPTTDPFSYEARVHVFARNRNLARAHAAPRGSAARLGFMTTAAREDRILTGIFGSTLDHSTFRWSEEQRRLAESEQNPGARYVSGVADHLITRVSERQVRAMMFAILIALLVADRLVARRISRSRPPASPERRRRSPGRTGPGTRR